MSAPKWHYAYLKPWAALRKAGLQNDYNLCQAKQTVNLDDQEIAALDAENAEVLLRIRSLLNNSNTEVVHV
jgi:hypothetical protein